MPGETGSSFEFTEEQKQVMEDKDISEDEVGDCISEKIDEGWERERAIAACLNMAREGSTTPGKNVDTMNPEEKEELVQELNETSEEVERKNFRVKGSEVEILKETDGHPKINVPIQALSEDRDGDIINEKGQEEIIRQLKSGRVPLVPNHGFGNSTAHYGFEDIFGQFVDGQNRNGVTIGTARMREGHDMTEELLDLLEQDMPVGFSVGFKVQEAEPREKENGEDGLEISSLDLMEVSAVGIPSNPEAVPQAMGSAVAMAKNNGLSEDEIMDSVKKAFQDTMSDKDEQSEQDTETTQNDDTSKSEEQNTKQFSDDDIQEILGVVGGALEAHMDEALQDIEAELQGEEEPEEQEQEEEEDEQEEEDEMDEDEEEDEEMSEEPGKEADAEEEKTGDTEEQKEEGDDDGDGEEKQSSGGDDDDELETTADKNQAESSEIQEVNDSTKDSDEEGSEEKDNSSENPSRVTQSTDYWG